MFDTNKGIKRIVSISAAALCMLSSIRIAPITVQETEAADKVMTAFEITENMQLGWNLGNSLDAYMSANNVPLETYGLDAETCWGNPKTTPELIAAVKAKGFNTIRVPVTWFQHVDKNNNYKIDEAWLARVKEVVDYCYNNDMYVILNLHHEEPYQNRSTLGADYEEISGYVTSLWGQLAETFKDYDQRLIFETMNEPRAKETDHEWWGPTNEEVDTINKINADALGVIRKAGGQNDTRLVMMPGYCASSDTSMMSKVVIPDDDFVAASVHAYSPYSFAMDDKVTDHSTFTEANKAELETILDGIRKTFIEKDIPVVIGEFSASDFGNTEARVNWADAYISTAKAYGFPCVIWDNNAKNNGGESHRYLNRSDNTWDADSEPVIDKMLEVLADDSIKWGSLKNGVQYEHEDITKGNIILNQKVSLDASVENGNCTEGLNATWKALEGGDVAIKYTGDTPVIAVVDGGWQNWTEIKAYDVDEEAGIAYYSSKTIESAWGGDVSEIAHLFARTNSTTTIEMISIIGGSSVIDPPDDNTKKYNLDLSKANSTQILALYFSGAAGSVINGCVGYMGEEWTNIEWEGVIGSDGTLMIEIPMSKIPEGVTSAEAQIWWCDDENGEMTKYEFLGTGVPDIVYGDADCDGKVYLNDAVLIMQAIGNPDAYGVGGTEPTAITAEGRINADCCDVGDDLTNKDALAIQMRLLNLIPSLPMTSDDLVKEVIY